MTLRQSWQIARAKLAALPDIDNPDLESEILLRHALQISRPQFYLDLENGLTSAQEKTCRELIERRLHGEPAAYIIGCHEFFGLDFFADPRVLIPRPETELLVEEAIKIADRNSPFGQEPALGPISTEGRYRWIFPKQPEKPSQLPRRPSLLKREKLCIADIGTGSGAIAVSLAVHLPDVSIIATDISAAALEVAAANCIRHGVLNRVVLLQGDLLEPLLDKVDILIANLPYVTTAELARMPSAKYEPRLALDGGIPGLDIIFRMIPQLGGKIRSGGSVLIEIGLGQSQFVCARLRESFPAARIEVMRDLAGIERVVKMRY